MRQNRISSQMEPQKRNVVYCKGTGDASSSRSHAAAFNEKMVV